MSGTKNLLDDIFGQEEEDVAAFADTILDTHKEILSRTVSKDSPLSGKEENKFNQAEPDKVDAPTLKIARNNYIEMAHGWHSGDYVWHIKPWSPKKQYRVTLKRVVYAIAKAMNEVIPSHIKVDIFLPNYKWEIPEITFKAEKLLDEWSIKDKDITNLNEKLFEVLNALV